MARRAREREVSSTRLEAEPCGAQATTRMAIDCSAILLVSRFPPCNCDATAAAHEPWPKKRQLSFVECQGLQSASSSIATMPVSVVGTELFNGLLWKYPASWSAPSAAPEDDGPPTKKETHVLRRGNGLGDGTTPYRSRRCARDAERASKVFPRASEVKKRPCCARSATASSRGVLKLR